MRAKASTTVGGALGRGANYWPVGGRRRRGQLRPTSPTFPLGMTDVFTPGGRAISDYRAHASASLHLGGPASATAGGGTAGRPRRGHCSGWDHPLGARRRMRPSTGPTPGAMLARPPPESLMERAGCRARLRKKRRVSPMEAAGKYANGSPARQRVPEKGTPHIWPLGILIPLCGSWRPDWPGHC